MANHQQVAHAWAHQTGRNCRGFNMYYEGPTIYSYGRHFPIARIVREVWQNREKVADLEHPVVLFNSRSHSISTSKHQAHVYHAIPSGWEVFEVENPTYWPNVTDWEAMVTRANGYIAKARLARKYGDQHLADARREIHSANRFNEVFRLGQPEVTFESLGVHIADIQAHIAAAQRAEQERLAAQEKQRYTELAAYREAWLVGDNTYNYQRLSAEDGTALLRVREGLLETSWGADVPLEHAVKAFRLVKLMHDEGREWHRNGHTLRVGHFQVDHINADGSMVAGCHRIGWQEIERIARQLGVFDVAPADTSEATTQFAEV